MFFKNEKKKINILIKWKGNDVFNCNKNLKVWWKKYFLWYKINILKKIRIVLLKYVLLGNMVKKNDSKMILFIWVL